jgi:hypothetical protein
MKAIMHLLVILLLAFGVIIAMIAGKRGNEISKTM